MSLDEYRHLWDGSESGWTLHRVDHVVWSVSFSFSETGPSQSEILALRKLCLVENKHTCFGTS